MRAFSVHDVGGVDSLICQFSGYGKVVAVAAVVVVVVTVVAVTVVVVVLSLVTT